MLTGYAKFDARGWVTEWAAPPVVIDLDAVRARMPRGRQGGEPTSEQMPGVVLPGHANCGATTPGVWYAARWEGNGGRGRFLLGKQADPPPDYFVWRVQQTRAGHVLATWLLASPTGIRRALTEGAKAFPCALQLKPCWCEECVRLRKHGHPPLHPDA